MMDLDVVPEHLVIIGGGYIGLEFAQMYRRFGSRVTLIEMGERLIRREADDISDAVREILEAEGIEIRLKAECLSLDRRGNSVVVTVSCEQGAPEVTGSHLLLAVGRRPNTDELGLEAAGIEVNARGHIHVDDALQTNVPGVWGTLGMQRSGGVHPHHVQRL